MSSEDTFRKQVEAGVCSPDGGFIIPQSAEQEVSMNVAYFGLSSVSEWPEGRWLYADSAAIVEGMAMKVKIFHAAKMVGVAVLTAVCGFGSVRIAAAIGGQFFVAFAFCAVLAMCFAYDRKVDREGSQG